MGWLGGGQVSVADGVLEVLVDGVEELLRREEILAVPDEEREILGHLPALDGLDAYALERFGELDHLGGAVHAPARGQRARPGEDRGDRVGGRRLALLVLAEGAGGGCSGGRPPPGRAGGGDGRAGGQPAGGGPPG